MKILEDSQIFSDLGLTKVQAEVYIELIRLGKTNVRTIWENCNIPRQEIYRILKELQKKGMIEIIFAKPTEFEAVSIQDTVSILLKHKFSEYKETEKKAKAIINRLKTRQKEIKVEEYQLRLISGKDLTKQRFAIIRDRAKISIEGIYFWTDFVNIIIDGYEKWKKLLSKGVETRFIVYDPRETKIISKMIQVLEKKGSFSIRYTLNAPQIILTISDKKETFLCLTPTSNVPEETGLWSDNLHLATVLHEYFEKIWQDSPEKIFLRPNKI